MTLQEMSVDYAAQAAALHGRIQELRAQRRGAEDPWEQLELDRRIRQLTALRKESRDLAHHLAHYYERGYRRHADYTI